MNNKIENVNTHRLTANSETINLKLILVHTMAMLLCLFFVSGIAANETDSKPMQIIVKYADPPQSANGNNGFSNLDARRSDRLPAGFRLKRQVNFGANPDAANLDEVGVDGRAASGLHFQVLTVLDDDKSMAEAVEELKNTGLFEYVEADAEYQLHFRPDDPLYPQLWGLNSTHASDSDINAEQAWRQNRGNNRVVIAVVDTGVDYNHPDISPSIWRNPGEIPGDGIDNDNNGVVDDVYGFDAIDQDGDPMDEYGHGTHVAGTIGAKGRNATGITGVLWHSKILPVKIFDQNGRTSLTAILSAMQYIYDLRRAGVNIVAANNSWGGGPFRQSLKEAIEMLNTVDVLFVASAGNDGQNRDFNARYPNGYEVDNVISVGSHTEFGAPSSFSNIGQVSVDVFAPGSDILSTQLVGGRSCQRDSGFAGYSLCSGTSMSTPHVSGIVGLLAVKYPNESAFTRAQRIIHSRSERANMVESRARGIAKADQALNYNGFTTKQIDAPILVNYIPIVSNNEPVNRSVNFSLGSLDSAQTNFVAQVLNHDDGVVDVSVAPASGVVSKSQSQQLTVNFDSSRFDLGLTQNRVKVADQAGVKAPVNYPFGVLNVLEATQSDPVVLEDLRDGNAFGGSVAIEGDLIAVGAYLSESQTQFGVFSGAVHLFRKQADESWLREAVLEPSDSPDYAEFGIRLVISEGRVLVSTSYHDSVYIYEKTGGEWAETFKLQPSDGTANNRFGSDIAFEGNHIAISGVGAHTRDPSLPNKLYLYHFDGSTWQENTILTSRHNFYLNSYTYRDIFASDFDFNGGKLAVHSGYRDHNFVSTVDLYQFENNQWSFVGSIDSAQAQSSVGTTVVNRKFGEILEFDQDVILFKGRDLDSNIYVFHQQANNSWSQVAVLSEEERLSRNGQLSIGTKLANNRLVLGAPEAFHSAQGSGAVYVYQRHNNDWLLTEKLSIPNPNKVQTLRFGFYVDISEEHIVAGMLSQFSTAGDSFAYVFDAPPVGSDVDPDPVTPKLETVKVEQVNSNWQWVNLENEYDSMVAVCTVHNNNNSIPVVTRIRKVQEQRFQLKLQNPGERNIVRADDVYCLVAEEGSWRLPNGTLFEAVKYTSSKTAGKDNWKNTFDQRSYLNQYERPVVLGQVMSANDNRWSTFFSFGSRIDRPVNRNRLSMGKHVGEDPVGSRLDETIGYMVFERQKTSIDGVRFMVWRAGAFELDNPDNNNNIKIGYTRPNSHTVLSAVSMGNRDGSWPILYKDAFNNAYVRVAMDEDQIADAERVSRREAIGYFSANGDVDVELIPVQ